jgi:hypothetical protein
MSVVAASVTDRGMAPAGRRRAEKTRTARASGPTLRLVATALGVTVSAAAWFFLVRAAIDFGQAARDGRSIAWLFTIAATLGATLCLVLVFVLCARGWKDAGLASDGYQPKRAAPGRRAR